jgi:general secretion pathway protein K
MRIAFQSKPRGIALIIVMIAIFVLAVLIGAFAYAMKVETKLAMNANREAEVIWLGRSGVELARWYVANEPPPGEPYESLNQKWAGGPGSLAMTNSVLAEAPPLENCQIGDGKVSVKITDLDRKFNINRADEPLLKQALTLVGVDAGEIDGITSSILDWIDTDDNEHMNGAESDYYQTLDPPYYAKNKPMDDLADLLFIKGVWDHQEIFWGSSSTNHTPAAFQKTDRFGRPVAEPVYAIGLAELFTPLSSANGKLNVNTASATVLQAIPLVDAATAAQIVQMRAGPDGVDGTDDDTPFRTINEVVNAVPDRAVYSQIARYCDVRSSTFQVEVTADIGGYQRVFHAIIGRNNPRDVQILSFYWD